MSQTLAALNQVHHTSASLRISQYIPTQLESPPIKKQFQFLREITFIKILRLLGIEDEKAISEILSRLREGSPFYDFTLLVHNLSKNETDFEFLTNPENLPIYNLISAISSEYDIKLLPYVNVLARITENRQYGLYSENQEVTFFFDEYGKYKDTVDAKEFLHQFRKILKYRTQKVFEQFINDGIFTIIRETLSKNSGKIASTQTLAQFVYCLHYYQSDISNDDENFLHEHIRFCVEYLANHEKLEFHSKNVSSYFPKHNSEKDAIDFFFTFFYYNGIIQVSTEGFIGLLKDICPNDEIYDFCAFLRENLCKNTGKIFDDSRSELLTFLADKIKEKAKIENIQIYKDISLLLPLKVIAYNLINGKQYEFQNIKLASIFTQVSEKIIQKCIDTGSNFASWTFDELMNKHKSEDELIVCTPLFANRKTKTFTSLKDAAEYLGIKEYDVKQRIENGDPCKGYKITLELNGK